jgi:proteasome lid subunit RPN8/RPN11
LAPQFGRWDAPQCPFSVEYSLEALERVRQHILERFYSIPRGGAEAGGVLFGNFVNGRIRVLASRPAACEYASGPTFALSPRDEAAFQALVEQSRNGSLSGMHAVGWYRSRTRGGPRLSEEDVDLWRRFFPYPWQLALVLQPASVGAMRAAFFFRDEDGSVETEPVYPEIQLFPRDTALPEQRLPQVEVFSEPAPEPPAFETDPVRRMVAPPALRRRRRARNTRRKAVFAVVFLGVCAAALLFRDRLAVIGAWWEGPPVNLQMEKAKGGILVRWDPRAVPVQSATGATLHIEEAGGSSAIPLSADQLRGGSASFRTQSGDPLPRLILRQPDGRTVVEVPREPHAKGDGR